MNFETLRLRESARSVAVTIERAAQQNSINGVLLSELNQALDLAERNPECRFFILEGQPGVFCTGMDFSEVAGESSEKATDQDRAASYMRLLRRLSLSPKVIVAKVDGKVTAGGVGLVAASDLALATERSQFSLSEALWGLLPACVIPYLIRRVGFQKAYVMTLSTLPVSAREALASGLLDEVTDDLDGAMRRLLLRIGKLEEGTIVNLKTYFRKMWIVNEEMERLAVEEITRLVSEPRVRENIRQFVVHQRFPWDAP